MEDVVGRHRTQFVEQPMAGFAEHDHPQQRGPDGDGAHARYSRP
jgi:hypothetical protein